MTLAFVVKCDWFLRLPFYFSDFLGLLMNTAAHLL